MNDAHDRFAPLTDGEPLAWADPTRRRRPVGTTSAVRRATTRRRRVASRTSATGRSLISWLHKHRRSAPVHREPGA